MAGPVDYKAALMAHIHDIPMFPGTLNSGEPNKKGTGKKRFQDLTGFTHDGLLDTWKTGGTTTSCNSFITGCATAMGYQGSIAMSQFEVAAELTARGLGHCWVTPDSGATPECGDIFRLLGAEADLNGYRKNHMGVVLDVNGTEWTTVEGGQGGKNSGCDKLCRKVYPNGPESLQGWVSMKALLNAAAPVPDWIGGWWMITEDPYDTWYYHFGPNGVVKGTSRAPRTPYDPPAHVEFSGTYSSNALYLAKLSWNTEDVDEELTFYMNADKKRKLDLVKGKTKRGNALSGERLIQHGKQLQ